MQSICAHEQIKAQTQYKYIYSEKDKQGGAIMTDSQMLAKNWLLSLQDYAEILKAEKRTLEMLEARLCRGVSSYEYKGPRDLDRSRAAHEDALAAYSAQIVRTEKAQKVYITALQQTQHVIEQLPAELQALAIDKYINKLSQRELEKAHNYGHTQIFHYLGVILEFVAEILAADKTELTPRIKQEATA